MPDHDSYRLGELFQNRREKGYNGLPLLSVTMHNGLVDRDKLGRKQETNLTSNEHLLVEPGDIAYNMMRMWQGAFGLAKKRGLVSPAYVVLRPKAHIDSEFASYLLKTPRLLHSLWAYSHGLTEDRLRLYYADFARIRARIPDLSTQRRVSEILRTWDAALIGVGRLMHLARQQKRGLLQRLLPRLADGQPLPPGWSCHRLGEMVTMNPARPKRPTDGKVTFVPMEAVSEDGRLVRRLEREYDEVRTGYSSFTDGDLLVAKITPCFENGKGALVMDLINGIGFGSTEFHVLRAKAGVDPRLLAHVVNSHEFRRRGESEMEGSAGQKRVSSDFIRTFRFACPASLEMQRETADMLDSADQTTDRLTQTISALRKERAAVAQRLFSATLKNL